MPIQSGGVIVKAIGQVNISLAYILSQGADLAFQAFLQIDEQCFNVIHLFPL